MNMLSVEEGNANLLLLAKFLDTIPPERWNYATVVGRDWKGHQDLSCGTTACAIGWACTIPEFRRFGLHIGTDGYVHGAEGWLENEWDGEREGSPGSGIFALDDNEWDFLFQPGDGEDDLPNTAPVEAVANRIREFVKARSE